MTEKQLQALQAELDVKKWNDTQAKGGMDTCGSYDYCVSCDKSVAYPCATAKTKFETPAKKKPASKKTKPATETVKAETAVASDKVVRVRKTSKKKA